MAKLGCGGKLILLFERLVLLKNFLHTLVDQSLVVVVRGFIDVVQVLELQLRVDRIHIEVESSSLQRVGPPLLVYVLPNFVEEDLTLGLFQFKLKCRSRVRVERAHSYCDRN